MAKGKGPGDPGKRNRRKRELVVDDKTGEILAREAPLSLEEKATKLTRIVQMNRECHAAFVAWEAAKQEATEAGEAYKRSIGRLREFIADAPQGTLFPAEPEDFKTDEEGKGNGEPPAASSGPGDPEGH